MLTIPEQKKLVQVSAKYVEKAVEVARRHHHVFLPYPYIGVPTESVELEPVYGNRWIAVPRELDNSIVPKFAEQPIHDLRRAGIPIQAQLILHEVKEELPAPERKVVRLQRNGEFREAFQTLIAGVGLLLFATVIATDPVLIACIGTHPDYALWVEVCRWEE